MAVFRVPISDPAVNGAQPPLNRVPLALHELQARVDRKLRSDHNSALGYFVSKPATPNAQAQYDWYEWTAQDGGTVRKINLPRRAVELGILSLAEETPVGFTWMDDPMPG